MGQIIFIRGRMAKIMAANQAKSWQKSYLNQPDRKNETEKKQIRVKVNKKGWLTKGEKLIYSVVGACLVSAGIFVVSFASATDGLNRDVQSLENNVRKQEVKNENLVYEKKEYSRPERITKIARKKGLKIQNAEVKQANALNR